MYQGEEERQAQIPPPLEAEEHMIRESPFEENKVGSADGRPEQTQQPAEQYMATSGSLALTAVEAKLTRDTETFSKMDPYCKISTR